MDSNLKGNIGETVALRYFIENGYEVYLPFGTATKCDLLVCKNNTIERVSVKTTNVKRKDKFVVKIRQGKLNKQIPFDPNSSDILFVYIMANNTYRVLKSKDITKKFEITIK